MLNLKRRTIYLIVVLSITLYSEVHIQLASKIVLGNETFTVKKTISPIKYMKSVIASYYGSGDNFHGKRTASGETFDSEGLTAAHKTLPFGTKVLVINPQNGKEVLVRINDRGPYFGKREIDLSYGAAKELDIVQSGLGRVIINVLG